MQRKWLCAAVMSVGALSACGGGGDGGGSSSSSGGSSSGMSAMPASAVAVDAATATATSDTAPPGQALVTVHAVESDGTASAVELATAATNTAGHFSLAFPGEQGRAYVIKVAPMAAGAPAAVAAAPLYDGPVLRGVLVPSSSGTVRTSISLTPFTEMAVAAATRTPGGLTPANVTRARTVMAQLLGFDPMGFSAAPAGSAPGADERRQALLLAAVSRMARDGALGCGSAGSAGQAMRCVVEQMAAAASTTTLDLGPVSGALASAIAGVLADPALQGSTASALLADTVSKLHCTGAGCFPGVTAATAKQPSDTAATARLLLSAPG